MMSWREIVERELNLLRRLDPAAAPLQVADSRQTAQRRAARNEAAAHAASALHGVKKRCDATAEPLRRSLRFICYRHLIHLLLSAREKASCIRFSRPQ